MATLAESFLADLEELSEDELEDGKYEEGAVAGRNDGDEEVCDCKFPLKNYSACNCFYVIYE